MKVEFKGGPWDGWREVNRLCPEIRVPAQPPLAMMLSTELLPEATELLYSTYRLRSWHPRTSGAFVRRAYEWVPQS